MATTSGIGNVNEKINEESEKDVRNDAIANEVLPSSTLSLAAKMEEKQPNIVEMSQSTEEVMAQSSTPTAAKRARQQRLLRLAVAGCSHGQMDTIYERLNNMERQRNVKFDLLICCGDFQVYKCQSHSLIVQEISYCNFKGNPESWRFALLPCATTPQETWHFLQIL
jgi:hypothetical protein